MASKPKNKMPIADRAKQFMPFSALKGLDEALRAKELEFVDKRELSEEEAAELNSILGKIRSHDKVKITYYSRGQYHTVEGELGRIDRALLALEVGAVQMRFDDISKIEVEHNEKD